MDAWLQWGLEGVRLLQGLGLAWKPIMQALTFLGTEPFYLLVLPLVYWCWESPLGLRLSLLLLLGGGLNTAFKIAFHMPRPYWVGEVHAWAAEISFGMPSGHAQHAATLWGAVAAYLRRAWIWATIGVLVLGIGLSRIYLGVHFPQDVMVGWGIGAAFLALALRAEPFVRRLWNRAKGPQRLLLALAASAGVLGLNLVARWSLGAWSVPQTWAERAQAATGVPIAPLSLSPAVTLAGLLFGVLVGLAWMREPWQAEGPWPNRLARYGLGMVVLVALYVGLALLVPHGEDAWSQSLRFIRYAVVGLWVTGLAPALFRRLNLAQQKDR